MRYCSALPRKCVALRVKLCIFNVITAVSRIPAISGVNKISLTCLELASFVVLQALHHSVFTSQGGIEEMV